jgi:hypothetical protein
MSIAGKIDFHRGKKDYLRLRDLKLALQGATKNKQRDGAYK